MINNKKIMICDTVFPIGHKSLNEKLITFLSKESQLYVINANNFYKKQLSNVKYIDIKKIYSHKNIIINQIIQSINIIRCRFFLSRTKCKSVIFFTFDTLNFLLGYLLFFNKKIYLFHHNNTDHLKNKYKLFFFNFYKNRVTHIVFAEFIKDYLVKEIAVKPECVVVLTHPLKEKNISYNTFDSDEKMKKVIGLGYANDERIIEKIIKQEQENFFFKRNNIQVYLRSKLQTYNSRNLQVIKGHMEESEYEAFFSQANIVLFLYTPYYIHRYSGGILDALKHKKKIIGPNIPIIKHFKEKYPDSCFVFHTLEELNKLILSVSGEMQEKDYSNFIATHAESKIKKELLSIIK